MFVFWGLAIWQFRFKQGSYVWIRGADSEWSPRRHLTLNPKPLSPHAEETTPREAAQLLLQSSLECPDCFEPFCVLVSLT